MNITEAARALYENLPHWSNLDCHTQSDLLVVLRDLQLEIDPENEQHATAQCYLDCFAVNIGVWIGSEGEIERIG